jgi:hypothetical protein
MKMLRPSLVTAWLFALWLAAVPSHAASSCYQRSELVLFGEVVAVVSVEQDFARGCWRLRLRLLDDTTPQGHAMFCGQNACRDRLGPTEGIFWWFKSQRNLNVGSISLVENGSCSDVTFDIVPQKTSETLWVDFIAVYEEHFFVPREPFRPRWREGLIGFSSFDGRSHCQDDEPDSERRGSICIMN